MCKNLLWIPVLWVACMLPAVAVADDGPSAARGQLLYQSNCNSCHSAQIHWRAKRLVKDWRSLLVQVRHWQDVTVLHWSDAEIIDVAHYLDQQYYHLEHSVQGIKPKQLQYPD